VFSPDGRRAAYVAAKGEEWFVVIDGVQSGPWKAIHDQGVLFSANGEHVAFAGSRAKVPTAAEGEQPDEWRVVLDGQESPPYKSAGQLAFAPVGGRFAYNAELDKNQWVVVIDGKPTDVVEDLSSRPTFSADGKRLAYSVARGQELFVVVDGVEGPAYERMSKKGKRSIVFSEDAQDYAYVGKQGEDRVVVVNGEEVARHKSLFQRTMRFLPGSTDMIYVVNNPQTSYLVFRGQQSQPYTRLIEDTDLVSPDGKRAAFAVRDGRQQFFVVDGVEGDRYAYLYPGLFGFTPDSRDFVYLGRRGKENRPVVHGWGRGPAYDEIPSGSKLMFTDEGTARFIGRRNNEYFLVEVLPREGR
jgi:Tol biopolymer transport system component